MVELLGRDSEIVDLKRKVTPGEEEVVKLLEKVVANAAEHEVIAMQGWVWLDKKQENLLTEKINLEVDMAL
jgi:hypothetical protein